MNAFHRFGLEHLATLLALASIATLAVAAIRRGSPRLESVTRIALGAFLAGGLAFALWDSLPLRGLDWLDVLPLHFCDMAVLIAIIALWTRNPLASEILYFWGLTGTLIAMLTPDVDRGFPDPRCISFFALHGMVLVSAVVLAFGSGPRPRPGADLKVFLLTNAYAAVIALIDLTANENYLYLRAKPSQPSLLDVMGPWPWYILAADALAFVLFKALMIPFLNRAPSLPHRKES